MRYCVQFTSTIELRLNTSNRYAGDEGYFQLELDGLFEPACLAGSRRRSGPAGDSWGLCLSWPLLPVADVGLLTWAAVEAARLLRQLHLHLKWVNCALDCDEPEAPGELAVRVTERAPPEATGSALGMAAWSGHEGGGAFIFYDRALNLRTHCKLLGNTLGRIMAHEIMHLLHPEEPHSEVGLMRSQCAADDLRFDSSALTLFPRQSYESHEAPRPKMR
jgi:hypothetical protein